MFSCGPETRLLWWDENASEYDEDFPYVQFCTVVFCPKIDVQMSPDHWGLGERIERIGSVSDRVLMSRRAYITAFIPSVPVSYPSLLSCRRRTYRRSQMGCRDAAGSGRRVHFCTRAPIIASAYIGSLLTTVIAFNTQKNALRNRYGAWRYRPDALGGSVV